jgi:carotenoid 1,2-hydratase
MENDISARGRGGGDCGPVSGGRQRASGPGRADGGDFGKARSGSGDGGPCFDAAVAPGGYRWWYLDAISEDGSEALVVIAFIGSVFSPYYALARREGQTDPENFCSINVALYGRNKNRWCMTERGRAALMRNASKLQIGTSALIWDGASLHMEIDEVAVPFPRRMRGHIRAVPEFLGHRAIGLDAEGQHHWRPIAPSTEVHLEFRSPELRWTGHGYWDSNWGSVPLEDTFESWVWSRGRSQDGTIVAYDTRLRSGERRGFCLDIGNGGQVSEHAVPEPCSMPGTLWRVTRPVHSETVPRVLRTLEDTPFYARSIVEHRLLGRQLVSVHESLSLSRFRMPIVQAMLPFRMPRRAGYLPRLSL